MNFEKMFGPSGVFFPLFSLPLSCLSLGYSSPRMDCPMAQKFCHWHQPKFRHIYIDENNKHPEQAITVTGLAMNEEVPENIKNRVN